MRSKYGNVKTTRTINKIIITFDSLREARRYDKLYLMARQGLIHNLTLQPKYELQAKFECDGIKHRAISYVADFRYTYDGVTVVEDVKGMLTDVYKLKKKLFLKLYGDDLKFVEVFK